MIRIMIASVLTGAAFFLSACQSGPNLTGPRAVDVSYSEQLNTRRAALAELFELAEDVRPVVRAHAIEALAGAPDAGVVVIENGLRDSNPGVRSVAAVVVGQLKLESTAGWVRPLVLDESEFVRSSAIFALTMLGEGVDATPLATTLFESKDSRARAHVAFLLGEMGSPTAVEMLRQASLEEMPRTPIAEVRLLRLQIAEAMIKLGESESLAGVYASLFPSRPEEFELTALAIQIIGEVQDRKSIDQLIYLASGKGEHAMPPEIRLAAADALSKLGLPQGGFIADEYAENRSEAIRAYAAAVYGRTDAAGNLGKLRSMLSDRSHVVRAAVAGAILRLTDGIE